MKRESTTPNEPETKRQAGRDCRKECFEIKRFWNVTNYTLTLYADGTQQRPAGGRPQAFVAPQHCRGEAHEGNGGWRVADGGWRKGLFQVRGLPANTIPSKP